MSGSSTLAVIATSRLDAGVEEALRLVAALVAGGGAVTLVEVGRGAGLLSAAAALPDELERTLEGLAAFGTVPRPVDAATLRQLLGQSGRLLRVADADRRGTPALAVVDAAWLVHVPDPALILAFEDAGQLIRA